jgi:serine/threonine-protein kinase
MYSVQANAPPAPAAARTFERVTVVRALGNRKVPSAIVHAFAPTGAEIVVVERHGGLTPAELDFIEADARTTMTLRHPNVASIRDVWRENGEVAVASELVEGETLEEVRRLGMGGKDFTLEVGVRVIVDVLAALSAVHTLGAGSLAHGEVTAANIIVGFDGLTRVVRPYRGRVAGKLAEPDWFSYAAPELIRGGPASVHGDLYAVGVVLWETLSRRKLFPKATREGRAARSLPVGKPAPPADATWAAPLAAVAERSLANDPAARYTSAAEMAAAVRLAVRSKLAMPPRVAAAIDKLAGERIIGRRSTNALPEAFLPPVSGRPSRPSVPPEAVRALAAIRPSSRPPPPMQTPHAAMTMPKAPPIPSVAIATSPIAPTPTPSPVVAKPRPPVPPIRIAEPKPAPIAPVIEPSPISIDEGFVEVAPESMKATTTAPVAFAPLALPPQVASSFAAPKSAMPGVPTEVAAIVPAGLPSSSNKRVPIIVGAIVLFALLVGVAIYAASGPHGASVAASATTAHSPVARPTETAATATATATIAPTTTTTTPSNSAAASSDAPENSAAPDTSASDTASPAAPETTHHGHARPRPTYDPMGI